MEIVASLCFTDGSYITLDGFDEILFLNQIPYVDTAYSGYSLQKEKFTYYKALNNLNKYSFIGINRDDNENEIKFGGKKLVYSNHYDEINKTIENHEILYIKTTAISTIIVY